MSLSNSRPGSRQSLPHIHSQQDFRALCQRCSPGYRFDRTLSQFRPRSERSAPSCTYPSEAAGLFCPSFVSLPLTPSPPVHLASPAPRPRPHLPRPAKLPVPNLAPLPLPTPLAHSAQTADTPLLYPLLLTDYSTHAAHSTAEYNDGKTTLHSVSVYARSFLEHPCPKSP